MAIVDYSTLQAAIANWLARADLTSVIPDFIQLAESRINGDLRVRKMQKTIYGLSSSGKIPLPGDYMGMLSFKASASSELPTVDLLLDGDFILDGSELLDGENIQGLLSGLFETFPQSPVSSRAYPWRAGLPVGYSVVGDQILLDGGVPASFFTMTYWAKIPALSASNQQTWLLQDEPGIYLYSALVEASPYTRDDERTVLWATQYKAIVDRLHSGDEYERYGNNPAMKLTGATP